MPNRVFAAQDHMIKGKTAVNNKALFIRKCAKYKILCYNKIEARGVMASERF